MFKNDFSLLYMCNFVDYLQKDGLHPLEFSNPTYINKLLLQLDGNSSLGALWRCVWEREKIQTYLEQFLETNPKPEDDFNRALLGAISLTLLFVQNNFTGPFDQLPELKDLIQNVFPPDFGAADKLITNSEEVNPNVQLPHFIIAAKELIKTVITRKPNSVIAHWWKMRITCLHQRILYDLTSDLYEEFKTTSDFLSGKVHKLEDLEMESLLRLEIAAGYLQFHRTQKCDEILTQLCDVMKMELKTEGVLGMRTKHQQKPLPQLVLRVKQREHFHLPSPHASNGKIKLPKLLTLNDDTRLEKVRFLSEEDNEVAALPSILQVTIFTKLKLIKRSQPSDRLADEELEPYITTLLVQANGPLQIRLSTLLLNIAHESKHRRTVERSFKQCEDILKGINSGTFSIQERLSYYFASSVLPKWEVQMQLAELMVSLGMTKTALDIYTDVQAWEQVIDCNTKLDMRHKAATIIRQEIEKKPTTLLYCLLGNATDDVSCYETAWNFSNESSAKAQAYWGDYYFTRKDYTEAIPHYEKSVEINTLQERVWARLGYAAIMLEKWDLAVHAYLTYTHLDSHSFEAWNNLAKALISIGDKSRAHRILGEALKCNYNSWKVWENFLVVSVDTGNFDDALNAYQHLSNMKDRYMDLEVLSIIVNAIVKETPDAKGRSTKHLLKKATTLLGHECVKNGSDERLWKLAALLAQTPLSKAQKLQRAYRAYTQKETNWATKVDKAKTALALCKDLCHYSLAALKSHDESEKSSVNSQLSSARLSAQACMRACANDLDVQYENKKLIKDIDKLMKDLTEVLKHQST